MRKIKKSEILRYFQYNVEKISEELNCKMDNFIQKIEKISNVKKTYVIFDIEAKNNKIYVKNSTLILEGNDIYNHLKNCKKIAIMLVTLGCLVDKEIKYYSKTNMYDSFLLNAVASEYIETQCDDVNFQIKEIAKKYNCKTTYRYSPGYGDFLIETQKEILKILKSDKYGVYVTDQYMMQPTKSVTAIIGLYNEKMDKIEEKKDKTLCNVCKINNSCERKKRGDICGKNK